MAVFKGVRGYGTNQYLFTNFPSDTTWRRVQLRLDEMASALYANHPSWVALSGGTRKVVDGAKNVGAVANENSPNVIAVAEAARQGTTFPDLVAVQKGEMLVLMEGHTRATAYVLSQYQAPIRVLVGSSAGMSKWYFY
jgi:hypothetical protein